MSNEIKVRVTTPRGSNDIILPLSQNDFEKTLAETGFYYYSGDEYRIENARSGLPELDKALSNANDFEELNYLAQLLDGLNEDEMERFSDILNADSDISSMRQIVNIAYNVNNLNFNIESSVDDIEDLGSLYVEGHDPATDELIKNNTDADGDIDYEGIGMELHISQKGLFTNSGYISNYGEMTDSPYDGKHFPPYYYGGDQTLALGVTLCKRGEEKGVDIFLPAENGVIRRALHRVGARMDNCTIKPCWGFPMPLAEMLLPASELGELGANVQRLSSLTTKQLRELFTATDNADIKTASEYGEFISEKIREIQMPEAVEYSTRNGPSVRVKRSRVP